MTVTVSASASCAEIQIDRDDFGREQVIDGECIRASETVDDDVFDAVVVDDQGTDQGVEVSRSATGLQGEGVGGRTTVELENVRGVFTTVDYVGSITWIPYESIESSTTKEEVSAWVIRRRIARGWITETVVAIFAMDRVSAGPTDQHVVAIPSEDQINAVTPDDGVVAIARADIQ